jgi:hypothetical protein
MTPRDCPRVGYRTNENTTQADIDAFFTSTSRHAVVLEHGWHTRMLRHTLYVYEFDPTNFYEGGGFYVSERPEIPVSMTVYDDLYEELFNRNIEVRLVENLWKISEAVQQSTLTWSLCKMANARQ